MAHYRDSLELAHLRQRFTLLFLIPNLFRRLFGEGALAAAFLPSYTKLQSKDPQLAKAFATLTISKLVTLLGALTIIGELILWVIVSVQQNPSASLQLTMVMLPYMPLVCLVAIFGAMLHVHDRFGPTAAAPIILNGFMIAAAFGLVGIFDNPFNHMALIGVSVVLAGIVQVAWSLLALRKYGWFTSETEVARGEVKIMMRRMLPMIVGLGTLQINTLFDGFVANWTGLFGKSFFFGLEYPLGEGSIGFNYMGAAFISVSSWCVWDCSGHGYLSTPCKTIERPGFFCIDNSTWVATGYLCWFTGKRRIDYCSRTTRSSSISGRKIYEWRCIASRDNFARVCNCGLGVLNVTSVDKGFLRKR